MEESLRHNPEPKSTYWDLGNGLFPDLGAGYTDLLTLQEVFELYLIFVHFSLHLVDFDRAHMKKSIPWKVTFGNTVLVQYMGRFTTDGTPGSQVCLF